MSIDAFFHPQSIAVIGASNKPGKVGYALAQRVLHYPGKIYFINPHAQSILGKSCYPSVTAIHGTIDLAIIAVPALLVKSVLLECGAKHIHNVVIISAGFAETRHQALQHELIAIARAHDIRILGPNTFGIVNTRTNLDTTFANTTPVQGNISCVSQSGALWSFIADYSQEHHLGFAKFISLGDMADVTFTDTLAYFDKDKETKVVLAYIENIADGRAFMRTVQGMRKPVVVLKAGTTLQGQRATLSHTGSLAGSYDVYAAAFKQIGAYHTTTLRDALAVAKFLSWQPRPAGKQVMIVTNAGGPGILCADALEEHGLAVVRLPRNEHFALPGAWSHANPIDVLGDAHADRYATVFQQLHRMHKIYDTVVVIATPQAMTDADAIAQEVVRFAKKTKKPVVCCFMGYRSMRSAKEHLEKHCIPCFHEVEDVARMLAIIVQQDSY